MANIVLKITPDKISHLIKVTKSYLILTFNFKQDQRCLRPTVNKPRCKNEVLPLQLFKVTNHSNFEK